jgi:hypothetical protein
MIASITFELDLRIRGTQAQRQKHHRKVFTKFIWEGSGSPRSLSSSTHTPRTDEEDRKLSNYLYLEDTVSLTPRNKPTNSFFQSVTNRLDVGNAFDPNNANDSINEWSWRCPSDNIAVVVTSSESDSTDITLSSEAPPSLPSRTRLRAASKRMPDVVSFPPLPQRKATSDWISPLPDIGDPLLTRPLGLSMTLVSMLELEGPALKSLL